MCGARPILEEVHDRAGAHRMRRIRPHKQCRASVSRLSAFALLNDRAKLRSRGGQELSDGLDKLVREFDRIVVPGRGR
jgi:hypothetical protein